jgi:membrane fusion protein, multidrug efflux system
MGKTKKACELKIQSPNGLQLRLRICAPVLLLTVACLSACSGESGQNEGQRPGANVGYIVAATSTVPVGVTLSGRTVAFETSEVRPQVTGVIRRRFFTEGSLVKAGQPLFEIDPSLYRAAVKQAEANLSSARASAEAAAVKADRYRPLADMEAIAKQDYTDALSESRVAKAAIAQNAASLDTAKINLRFTSVPAPITGRIGRSLATVGALASATQTDRMDPIYVDMQQSATELTALRRRLAEGGALPGSTDVKLQIDGGTTYPLTGTVQFSEVTVDQTTGTVTLRARFPNPDGILLPGMFVTAMFDQASDPNAILVPQNAVQRDFDGTAYVMLVGADNKAVRRKVSAERTYGANAVVTSGLKKGDKVIVQGLNGLRQGAPIKAVPSTSAQKVAPPQDDKAVDGAPAKKGD